MMEHMRHTGKSGKFAVICGIVAAGLLVLTAMTLAEPVFLAFAGVLGLSYLAAVAEVLVRRRHAALFAAGAGTALALGFSLAFLSTWELAFDGQTTFLGTPLPTDDPDNYFIGAAGALVATFGVLFLGALWPGQRRTAAARRQAAQRGPSQRGTSQRTGATAARVPRAAAPRSATPRTGAPKTGAPRTSGQGAGAQGAAAQRTSAPRTPARGTSSAARRPSSSAPPSPRPAPRSGNGPLPRR